MCNSELVVFYLASGALGRQEEALFMESANFLPRQNSLYTSDSMRRWATRSRLTSLKLLTALLVANTDTSAFLLSSFHRRPSGYVSNRAASCAVVGDKSSAAQSPKPVCGRLRPPKLTAFKEASRCSSRNQLAVTRRVAVFSAAGSWASIARWAEAAEEPEKFVFPPAWAGNWSVERQIEAVEGDTKKTEKAWRLLGGEGDFNKAHLEEYTLQLLRITDMGEEVAVIDWQSEICSRCCLPQARVRWDQDNPNLLTYDRMSTGTTTLHVDARSVLPPVYRYSSFEDVEVLEASGPRSASKTRLFLKVGRRFQPIDDQGNTRGTEYIKTYDDVQSMQSNRQATSETRSTLKLQTISRPYSNPAKLSWRLAAAAPQAVVLR